MTLSPAPLPRFRFRVVPARVPPVDVAASVDRVPQDVRDPLDHLPPCGAGTPSRFNRRATLL
jgi:hypothetical protein